MGELTKIAAILFKNLSNALAATASELKHLDSAPPLSQASEKPESVSIKRTLHKVLWGYQPRDKVIVKLPDSESPSKMRILKKMTDSKYLAYYQGGLKAHAKEITIDMILGLDPDR